MIYEKDLGCWLEISLSPFILNKINPWPKSPIPIYSNGISRYSGIEILFGYLISDGSFIAGALLDNSKFSSLAVGIILSYHFANLLFKSIRTAQFELRTLRSSQFAQAQHGEHATPSSRDLDVEAAEF